MTPHRLAPDAAEVMEEWLAWFRNGELSEGGVLAYFRQQMDQQ